MWDLPGPEIEPVSPALAGGFLTTAPPRKSKTYTFCPSFLPLILPPTLDEELLTTLAKELTSDISFWFWFGVYHLVHNGLNLLTPELRHLPPDLALATGLSPNK